MPDIKPFPDTTYYEDALGDDVARRWGDISGLFNQKPGSQLGRDQRKELCFYLLLTCFYNSSQEDMERRQKLLYYNLARVYATRDDAGGQTLLAASADTLPTASDLPKIVDNLCIAYNTPPTREWKTGGKKDEKATGAYKDIYERGGFNGRLQINYRYQKLCSGTLLRPYLGEDGRMQLEILTPDLVRYEVHPQYPDKLLKVIKPLGLRDMGDGKPQFIYEVFTADYLQYVNEAGEGIEWQDDKGEPIPAEGVPNIYRDANGNGVIPFMVSRLVEPNTSATFGGGLAPIVDGMVQANEILWQERMSRRYESFGTWVAINLEIPVGVRMGFGTMIKKEITDPDAPAPSLDHVTGSGAYPQLSESRKEYLKGLMRSVGLPESVVDAMAGAPSGIARIIERAELLEQRQTDLPLLATTERKLSDLVAVVWNTEVAPVTGQRLPFDAECHVTFAEEGIFEEPEKLYALNLSMLNAGHMTLSRFLSETTGKAFTSDEEAVAFILTNKKTLQLLNAPAPDATTPPPPDAPGIDTTTDAPELNSEMPMTNGIAVA